MKINLSDEWKARARAVGKAQYADCQAKGRKHHGNKTDDNFESHHIVGAIAEASVAKFFGVPWRPTLGTVTEIDVAGKYEVRTRRVPGTGTDLAIRPQDKDDLPYIHTHIFADESVEIIGWIYGREGKGAGPWCESKCVWYIGPPYRDLETLKGPKP